MPEMASAKDNSVAPNIGNLDSYDNKYKVIEYLTNTSSLLITTADKYEDSQVKEINDSQLSRYYDLKKTYARRHSSVASGSDYSSPSSKNISYNTNPNNLNCISIVSTNTGTTNNYNYNTTNNNASSTSVRTERVKYQLLMNNFLNCSDHKIEPYQLKRRLSLVAHRKQESKDYSRGLSLFPYNSNNDNNSTRLDEYSEALMGKDLVHRFNDFSFPNSIPGDAQTSLDIDEEMEEQRQHDEEEMFANDSDYEKFTNNHDFLHQSKKMIDMNFVNSYRKYYKKLLTVGFNNLEVLKRHNLWVPIIRDDCKDLLVGEFVKNEDIYTHKTCPLFIKGLDYIPTIYDTFSGCSVMKSIFSEYKFPALIYHSSITMNKRIFLFGGLIPCYRYDAEAPNPNKYYVDPIKNLPPPLLPDIINNPTLVNNPHLYIYSIESSRLLRPTLSGQIPPPLLCMTASQLTDRHIFFYGGFEIKTETKINRDGKYYLKRSAFLNNTVYILDTVALHFTKVDVVAQSYKHVKYPTFAARFGHMQVSTTEVKDIGYSCSNQEKDPETDTTINPSSTLSTPPVSSSSKTSRPVRMSPRGSTRPLSEQVNHGVEVFSVIIFGGYRQTGDDKYEAMNDMWKFDIKVVGRGKRNFLIFADTVVAVKIPIVASEHSWPSKRAFFAYNIPSANITNCESFQAKLLKNLEDNFTINFKSSKHHETINSTVTFDFGKGRSNSPQVPMSVHNRKISSSSGASAASGPENLHHSVSMQRDGVGSTNSSTASKGESSKLPQVPTIEGKPLLMGNTHQSSCPKGRIIVIHGGSNNTDVFGDMWWFDLDKGTWKRIDTFDTRTDEPRNLINAHMRLVGHSMTSLGYMAIMAGGLSQRDVKNLYPYSLPLKEVPSTEDDEMNDAMERLTTRNSIVNIINLRTCCIQGSLVPSPKVTPEPPTLPLESTQSRVRSMSTSSDSPPEQSKSHLVSSIGGGIVESDGSVFLIGGLTARREALNKMYLRGSLLEFVLPSKSLAS